MTGATENLIAAAIDAAEEITDPLDGLVGRVADDPGAPFVPDVLERLSALKKEDRAAFEALRAQLKKAGCRVSDTRRPQSPKSGFPAAGESKPGISGCVRCPERRRASAGRLGGSPAGRGNTLIRLSREALGEV